ncbi:MAG: DUF523 domain-containing protein [Clostridiales bacterium]|nr:DUF523 domain-containing protein [Clostridiales bacterium]
MYIVSACLAGVCTRYDAKSYEDKNIIKLIDSKLAILVCPEQLGGLSTPRPPAEIVGGDGNDVLEGKAAVINKNGEDVTKSFIKGAEETLRIAVLYKVNKAILKSSSPSCGCGRIYDGSFSGNKIDGDGITSALLKKNGIEVITEEELQQLITENCQLKDKEGI